MKTAHSQNNVRLIGAVWVLGFGLGSLTFAGPGPQYWQQRAAQAKARAEVEEIRSEVASSASPTDIVCPYCKTSPRMESAFYNVSGKIAPRTVLVGKAHTCDACGATTANTHRAGNEALKKSCPVCAKAAPSCCPAEK